MKIDSDKQGYIKYPDGTYQATVSGVIDTTWSGNAGNVRLIVPNYTDPAADKQRIIMVSNTGDIADYSGQLRFKGVGKFYAVECPNISSVIADKAWFVNMSGNNAASAALPKAESVFAANCTQLTSLIAPFWNAVDAPSCALTAKTIGDLLLAAVQNNPSAEYLNCTGGTNASDTAIDDYLITKGTDLNTVLSALPNLAASFNT